MKAATDASNPNRFPRRLGLLASALLMLTLILLLTSCGSLIEGQSGMGREIVFTSEPPGALITLNGVPKGTTPSTIAFNPWELARGHIAASKDGYQTVKIEPTRGVNPTIAGNAIIGGLGGVLVDGLSGSAIRNAKSIHLTLQPTGR
jgi:hypothetical protein